MRKKRDYNILKEILNNVVMERDKNRITINYNILLETEMKKRQKYATTNRNLLNKLTTRL